MTEQLPPRPRAKGRTSAAASIRWTVLILLGGLVMLIAARTEWLNVRAGHVLPRHEAGKWRVASVNEARWKQFRGPKDDDGRPVTRPLTPDENKQMRADLARRSADAELRDWVGTMGCLQYLLLPALSIAILESLASRPTRRQAALLSPLMLIAILASASLIYRSYFASLGW